MNLRRITLKYMGWCPGVKAAARFVHYKQIKKPISMRFLTATIVIFTCYTLLAYAFYPPIPEGPLKVTIYPRAGKQVILDHEFNESYDYGLLFGREWKRRTIVVFREKLNLSEFASGAEAEVEDLTLETLEEVCQYVREEVGAPNVVVGLTGYLLNQSFEETYFKIWGKPLDQPERGSFGHLIGDVDLLWHPRGVIFDVVVARNYQMERVDGDSIWEGLWIRKSKRCGAGRYELIWELQIDAVEIFFVDYYNLVLENPCYEVRFIRYPRGYGEDYSGV